MFSRSGITLIEETMEWKCREITAEDSMFICEQLWKALPEGEKQRLIILKSILDTAEKDREWNPVE
jgi:hypothetical protein